jgi:hypothetical protein
MWLFILALIFLVALLSLAASTVAIGKTCQWLRRRLGLDEDALPAGGFEVVVKEELEIPPSKLPEVERTPPLA